MASNPIDPPDMTGLYDEPYDRKTGKKLPRASNIDDPFEGKKLTDLEEWDKKSKGKATPKARTAAKTGKKGVQSALKAAPRALGAVSRLAPPVAAGMLAGEIYTGLKDPDFMVGLMNMFGGEEKAYNAWAAQQAEEGVEMPSYEEWRAHAEKMAEAGELDPDAIEERRPPLEDTDMTTPEKRLAAASRAIAKTAPVTRKSLRPMNTDG